MFAQVCLPLEPSATMLTRIRPNRHMRLNMGNNVVSFPKFGLAVIPPTSQCEIASPLSPDMEVRDVTEERFD